MFRRITSYNVCYTKLLRVEVDVTSQASDGTPIDRAAFLTFEAEPPNTQIATTRLLVGVGIVLVVSIVFVALRMLKKRSS